MARHFSLAGLLRLRHIQEEQAANDLATANARLRDNFSRQARARTVLGESRSNVTNSQSLLAVAASRASSRSMLADLEAAGNMRQNEAVDAQKAFQAARAQSIGLEKLEEKHHETVAADDLHLEQSVLDEIASGAWHRGREGGTR